MKACLANGRVAALNFGFDRHPTHADRYKGAGEFVDVVTKPWDSWEDDALIANPEAPVCHTSGRRESAHALS
ncbi:hypothetical protein GCM10010869_75970 [Mesorhizobium tianshanense]|nr:hypothetical protein GCM10010869_75970 [Mesorhizobium tianshanense]